MNLERYRQFWDRHLDRTRHTETLLTDDPERFTGRYACATVDVLLRHVDRTRLASMTLLDYGCGTGRLARIIAPLCRRMICADISQSMVDECRRRLGYLPNVEFLLVDGRTLPSGLDIDFAYSYAAIQYFSSADDFWHTVDLIDRSSGAFCLHLHNSPNEAPDPLAAPELREEADFDGVQCYRPAEATVRSHYSGPQYLTERHAPDVRGDDIFFYKTSDPKGFPSIRPRHFMQRDITFFHTDKVEWQTTRPIAAEAERRGYRVRFSDRMESPAEIGFYCSHVPFPVNSRLSAIMLHDLAQRHDIWPDYWLTEPWSGFDLGFLPGPSWSERWFSSSRQPQSRSRRGVYQLGWPKADALFHPSKNFRLEAAALRSQFGLRHARSILYAPSWENHGKQNDFVRALGGLSVNLLLKQAPWSDKYPQVLASISEMNALHRHVGPDVHIIEPEVDIIHCLALADLMVSDESSVLIEALLLGIPGIAVMDWLIPDCTPPRRACVPFDFVFKTELNALSETARDILARPEMARAQLDSQRDRHFSHLGQSAARIMDVLDACVEDRPIPLAPLTPRHHPVVQWAKNIFMLPERS